MNRKKEIALRNAEKRSKRQKKNSAKTAEDLKLREKLQKNLNSEKIF